ncbi:hypothetical protein AWU67_13775 [Microterricola viridarii]|uniref:D-alanyl-D-alanine carboxypeptidase-like core domain-containing protein n=1 Tax=Microterricola viridarii TaxID=412690 RepID=A0A109QY60_9MICO|nr:hypothetical protein AWU67_13775 [Microterricola viridarii]
MRQRRTIAAALLVVVIIAAIAIGAAAGRGAQASNDATGTPTAPVSTPDPTSSEPSRPSPEVVAPPAPVPAFDKSARSIDDPNSIWLVVNKLRPLNPADYAPGDLVSVGEGEMRAEPAAAFDVMVKAAAADGYSLIAASAYRSYTEQSWIYAGDDELTARPGYSEHQTGLTVDIATPTGQCRIYQCFGDMPEGAWLRDNAWKYGFLLRYPADKTAVTGYEFEPWHFRYIGTDLSTEMHNTGFTTLEEFFGLPAAPVYP